jgi:antitoxin component of RelBE/YafQ-DinJ toxin-antitoxin module
MANRAEWIGVGVDPETKVKFYAICRDENITISQCLRDLISEAIRNGSVPRGRDPVKPNWAKVAWVGAQLDPEMKEAFQKVCDSTLADCVRRLIYIAIERNYIDLERKKKMQLIKSQSPQTSRPTP